VEELPDSPLQQAAQAGLAVAARPAAATTRVAVDLRTVEKPTAAETDAVPAHINLFLGALDARKAEKKAMRLTMPDAAAGGGKASMQSKKKNKKNKHKNKKSQSPAKSKTTPKKVAEKEVALIATAKDTTEATPATKASTAKAAGTLSKGGDKGKGKAMHKMGLILGCAKCRWSVKGCGQCRSESFSGHRWNITC
jgi:hypothetical protein